MKNVIILLGLFLRVLILTSPISYAQWLQTNGLGGINVHSLASHGIYIFAGTSGNGTFLSNDNGSHWTAVNSGPTTTSVWTFAISPNGPNGTNIFAGTLNGGVFLSTDNGNSWIASGVQGNQVYTLATSGTNLFAGTDGGIFHSTNNGIGWNAINSGLPPYNRDMVYSIVTSDTNLFAAVHVLGGVHGPVDIGWGVYRSTDNGTSWVAVNSGLTNLSVNVLMVSGTNLFAGTEGEGIFLSTNNGTSWNTVNSGLPTYLHVKAFTISDNGLFAGTDGKGVFLSTNNGASWNEVNSGLTNLSVYALTISGSNLLAGTYGGGVYWRPLSEVITEVNKLNDTPPCYFKLHQNYPNPFNPSTSISFTIPSNQMVELTVYDMLGREIAELINEYRQTGSYSAQFNASHLASGIYFYKLKAGNFVQTKKLILLK